MNAIYTSRGEIKIGRRAVTMEAYQLASSKKQLVTAREYERDEFKANHHGVKSPEELPDDLVKYMAFAG
jgi:hypothetical protein